MIQNTRIRTIGVGQNTSISINIVVGNAQPSNTSIYHNGSLLTSNNGDFTYNVSNVAPGHQVFVVTTASDIPQNVDIIMVTHSVQNPLDIVDYNNKVEPNEIAINTTKYYLF